MDWSLVYLLGIILFLINLPVTAHAMPLRHGKVSNESIYSKSKNVDGKESSGILRFRLYLPASYDENRQSRFPVLYLLHRSFKDKNDTQCDSIFPTLVELISRGNIPAFIAVAQLAENSDGKSSMVYSDYESAVILDLIPYIDAHYRTLSDRVNRFISGLGVGGYDALCFSLAYPQLFEACVLLNPDLQENNASSASRALASKAMPKEANRLDEQIRILKSYSALLKLYAQQEVRVRFYIFAADDWYHSCERKDINQNGYLFNVEQQAVDLYTDLHRKNLFDLPFEKGQKVPGNEAQLRIMSGGCRQNTWLEGLENGLRYLWGQPESVKFSPQKAYRHVSQKGILSEVMTLKTAQGTALDYRVYTPFGFRNSSDASYPVLYLLHGSNGTASSWDDFYTELDWMIEHRMIKPLITVAPITGNSYWVDSEAFGAVETAVINGLIPEIDKMYPTQPERCGRALVGCSMGGFGCVYYGMRHPELFGFAVLLSPFVQNEEAPATSRAATGSIFVNSDGKYDDRMWRRSNYPELLSQHTTKALPVCMFIYVGDEDWNHLSAKEDLHQDAWRNNMEYQAVQLYLALKNRSGCMDDFSQMGVVSNNSAQLHVVKGGHDKTVWLQGFIEGLHYIEQKGFGMQK